MMFWLMIVGIVALAWPAMLMWALQAEMNDGFRHFNRKVLSTGFDGDMQVLRLRWRVAELEARLGIETDDFDAFRDDILWKAATEGRDYLYIPIAERKKRAFSDFEVDFLTAVAALRKGRQRPFPNAMY